MQDPRTDRELVDAADGGDAAAFEALYFRYRAWAVRLAYRFTGNRDDALDVMQEAFTYLLGKFPGFRLTARMTTFLYPVIKHLAITMRRRRGRYAPGDEVLEQLQAPDAEATAPDDLATVMQALPAGQREVVLMRFVDGMALAEIAEALEIPVGTAKSRLHNALQTLRDDRRSRRYFLG